ncbi:MAG: molybdopterin-dependent oxidoreductase [Coriobacteriia bacterium]|nr:molybdopterin-dependent oxidoreductase [Coriobacteriia bacterium]
MSTPWKTGTDDDFVVRTTAWSAPGCHPVGCGVKLHIKDGKLVGVEGDEESPITHGRLCVRCLALDEYLYHPDRILYPMKRAKEDRGKDKFERITWDEAFDTIVDWVTKTREKYGYQGVAVMGGTGREATLFYPVLSYAVLQTPNCGTPLSGASCYGPRCTVTNYLMGAGYPEIDHAAYFPDRYDNPEFEVPEYIIIWGKTPLESNADGFFGHAITDMMKRGTKIITVDPRVTWLGSRAEYNLQVRPGTDAALGLAMINLIIEEDLYDHEFVENWTYGFDELKERVKEYTVERAADITWIPKEKIIAATRAFAKAKNASIQWGVAVDQMSNGLQMGQTILDLAALTGNIDNPGGITLAPKASLTGKWRYETIRWVNPELVQNRIGNDVYPANRSALTNLLADPYLEALETDQPYAVRLMWINSCNPYACPGAVPERWHDAFLRMDYVIVQEAFMTPAAMGLADLLLPVSTYPERDGIVLPHFGRNSPMVGAMNKVIAIGEAKSDFEICLTLGRRLNPEAWPWETVQEFLDFQLVPNAGFTFEELREKVYHQPHYEYYKYKKGLCRADREPGFETVTGLFELRSLQFEAWGDDPLPYFMEPQYSPNSTPELYEEFPLVLTTGGRKITSFHSEHRQIPSLREIDPWPIVQINPVDAEKYGIVDGGWVGIENQFGKCRQKAEVTPTIMPGVIHACHAWWYPEQDQTEPNQGGYKKSNINMLMPHFHVGPLYVGAPYKCLLCKVYPVQGLEE